MSYWASAILHAGDYRLRKQRVRGEVERRGTSV